MPHGVSVTMTRAEAYQVRTVSRALACRKRTGLCAMIAVTMTHSNRFPFHAVTSIDPLWLKDFLSRLQTFVPLRLKNYSARSHLEEPVGSPFAAQTVPHAIRVLPMGLALHLRGHLQAKSCPVCASRAGSGSGCLPAYGFGEWAVT